MDSKGRETHWSKKLFRSERRWSVRMSATRGECKRGKETNAETWAGARPNRVGNPKLSDTHDHAHEFSTGIRVYPRRQHQRTSSETHRKPSNSVSLSALMVGRSRILAAPILVRVASLRSSWIWKCSTTAPVDFAPSMTACASVSVCEYVESGVTERGVGRRERAGTSAVGPD